MHTHRSGRTMLSLPHEAHPFDAQGYGEHEAIIFTVLGVCPRLSAAVCAGYGRRVFGPVLDWHRLDLPPDRVAAVLRAGVSAAEYVASPQMAATPTEAFQMLAGLRGPA